MKCIIAGSRTAQYHHVVRAILDSPFDGEITEIVCGCAAGADTHGATWGAKFHIPIKFFPAQWSLYGKSAGPIRNREMSEYADALILCWTGRSPGSANMLKTAKIHKLLIHEYIFKPEVST